MRYALAVAVVAVGFAAAVFIHQRHTYVSAPGPATAGDPFGVASGSHSTHPSWEDPTAVLMALGGLAVAVGIVFARRNT